MNIRKDPLVSDQIYHVFSRSIAKYVVFNRDEDYQRLIELISLYRFKNFNYKYSAFKNLQIDNQIMILSSLKNQKNMLVDIVGFVIMPTHVHLILKQVVQDGISIFMSKVLNSYSKYFNTIHHRNGPLWEGHFKNVLVESDEQFLHLTRYIHLNPSSAGLLDDPFDWPWSSLAEYIGKSNKNICQFDSIIDLAPKDYKKFVLDYKGYQREISIIKSHLIDDYSG